MLVTQTNEQAFDLARRLAVENFPRLPFTLFVTRTLQVPDYLLAVPNLTIVREGLRLPVGPCVVIANAKRWSWIGNGAPPFDLQIIDEAFQLPDYGFHQIAGLARRVVLVGDPGQIDPFVTCEIERWRCDPAGPHVPCPRALAARHPGILPMTLPVSRRLVPDTVRFVQPAFYPALTFTALSAPGDRGLRLTIPGVTPVDAALDAAQQGASLVQVELPRRTTGEVDDELADTIVGLVGRLFERGTHIRDDGQTVPLTPDMVGVVCAHVSQVNAVRERLPAALSDVFVETSNRFQGLERPVMVVYHPLSGRADADEFHLDAGRLCVMLSRHRVVCFLVARGGIEELLLRYAPSGDRVLGSDEDSEFEGWRAHIEILEALRRRQRVFRLPTVV
jgi:hypothetical protein